jgi:predicted nucleic acid-binding protein
MWKDGANLYHKLEDDIEALKSLRASFFKGESNVIALATTIDTATL